MNIDSSFHSHVILCDECEWRTLAATSATAIKLYALHLKNVHGDRLAANRAMGTLYKRAERARKRALTAKT